MNDASLTFSDNSNDVGYTYENFMVCNYGVGEATNRTTCGRIAAGATASQATIRLL